jgi:fatty acid CoA ligase FadD36
VSSLLPSLSGALGDHPDAMVVHGERRSWSQLADEAALLATQLVGVSTVAVDALPTLDTVRAVVAALMAGVPIVPVPPDAGPGERSHILRDSRAQAVIGSAPWAQLPEIRPGSGTAASLGEPPPESPALVMYTSGTTGSPKGVVLSRRALAAGLDGLADAWLWTPDDVLVHGLPLFHVHGLVLGVLGALRVGSRLVHTGRPTPQAYADAADAGGSLFFGVPTVWGRLCAEPSTARTLARARLLVSGSAPLPVSVFEQLSTLTGHAPVERYGMTETLITLSTRADGERRPGWVGRPIDGVSTRTVDDDGRRVEPGVLGELQVRGATLFDGYLGRPEATAASFDGEWFRTGDAVVTDDDHFHRIVGRQSMDIIKTGGFKVGAGEVEASLLGHPAVREVAVVGIPDDDLGQRIVAFVVGDAVDPAVLIDHVASDLSVHKRPREVRFVAALPRNAMGKVQKHILPL